MLLRWIKFWSTALLVVTVLAAPATAQPNAAMQKIELFNATLLSIMQNAETLKFGGRYKTLSPVMLDSFDLGFMARFSAGRYWRGLSPTDQQKLVATFERLWVSTYADRFDGYSGETFEIVGLQKAPRDTLLVKSNIIKNDGEKIALNYLMREKEKHWLVIDIFLDGKYSELAKQRSEYTSILKREGLAGLVAKVDAKVKRMQNSGQ
ncbi:MAG: ABC transporter substrate-binding protein [Alphaproteobacteria bacterium]